MTHVPVGCPLTKREYELVVLLADGLEYKQVAAKWGRSVNTVRQIAHRAYKRLDVASGGSAAIKAYRAGWLPMGDRERPGLRRLESLLLELITIVRDRRERDTPEADLTAAQRAYLKAFDAHLRARTDVEMDATRGAMTRELLVMLGEAGVVPRQKSRCDLVGLISNTICA